jgi:hypothetical protein
MMSRVQVDTIGVATLFVSIHDVFLECELGVLSRRLRC